MKNVHRGPHQTSQRQLERVIEPLASYISAASRPRAALLSALAVLFREVEATDRAADEHVAVFVENRCS